MCIQVSECAGMSVSVCICIRIHTYAFIYQLHSSLRVRACVGHPVSEQEQQAMRVNELCARLVVIPLLSTSNNRVLEALDALALVLQANFTLGLFLCNYDKIRRCVLLLM